jgi:hypothetical protein
MSNLLTAPIGLDLTNWTPKTIKDIQLVLCRNEAKEIKLATGWFCYYTTNGTSSYDVPTYQIVEYYDLYVAKTGVKLISFRIPGAPVYCPSLISINAKEIVGYPDDAGLFKKLSTYLQMPIPSPTPTPSPTPIVYSLQCDIDLKLMDTGYLHGSEWIQVLNEQIVKITYNYNDSQKEETVSGKVTKVIITYDRVLRCSSGRAYYVRGTITVSKEDPKLTYDITVTGGAFANSPQTCKKP